MVAGTAGLAIAGTALAETSGKELSVENPASTGFSAAMMPQMAEETEAPHVIVPIAGLLVSNEPQVMLETRALGACVGIAAHDPGRQIGALMHVLLPAAGDDGHEAGRRPAMYADTGVAALVAAMAALGSSPAELVVTIAGGGHLLSAAPHLALGQRNVDAVRAACAANGLTVAVEHVGGLRQRDILLHVRTGRVMVRSRGKEGIL
jgi:chemotaxis protein CheD